MNEVVRKVFAYDGNNVTFARKDGVTMVNATQMAKKFSKLPADWTRQKSTKEFISALMDARGIHIASDLLKVVNGDKGATWMHEDVAIEFARWLSPKFAIWCNDRIKELLTIGITATPQTIDSILSDPDNAIRLLTELKNERQQRELAESRAALLDEVTKEQAAKIEKDAPKVEHHDIFMGAEHGEVDVSVRKFIAQAGIKGEKKFWHWLEYEKKNIIYRDSKGRPMPYAGKHRHIFAMPDKHNEKNDWSGTQLMITPTGKAELAKMYYKDHPENFYETSKVVKQLQLFQ